MIVAQISDLHVRRRGHVLHYMPNTASYVRRIIGVLNDLQPDLVVATGDLTESGSVLEYRRLRGLMRELRAPFYLLPGNHDRRAALRRVFHDHTYLTAEDHHASYTIDAWPIRIIALDTSEIGHIGGYVDDVRIAWLDAQLSEFPNRPTVIAMHHPPFRTGIAAYDRHHFTGREALAAIVRSHRNIARIASGHIHTVIQRPWSGTLACTAPSTAPGFVLGRSRLGIGLEDAGFLLHEFDWDAGISTSRVRLNREIAALTA